MIYKPLILSTAYLPPIDYWVAIMQHKEVWFETHENYQKQSYRNRCRILGPNGVQDLNIPIAKSGKLKTPIQEVGIFNDGLWQKIHWKSMETAYNSSPFFLHYADYFEACYSQTENNLSAFNLGLIELVFEILELEQQIDFTKRYIKEYKDAVDMRGSFHPKLISPYQVQLQDNPYIQVFSDRHGFVPNLSILDLIFNLGPEANAYLSSINV